MESLKIFFKKLQTAEIIEFENYDLATFGKRSFNKNYKIHEQSKVQKAQQLQFVFNQEERESMLLHNIITFNRFCENPKSILKPSVITKQKLSEIKIVNVKQDLDLK